MENQNGFQVMLLCQMIQIMNKMIIYKIDEEMDKMMIAIQNYKNIIGAGG